ncbi:MAG: hypothetical protein QGI45_11180, partial [Myxococcota bacterium]|nr:hypothetical protein [Myxococcota bacterium]
MTVDKNIALLVIASDPQDIRFLKDAFNNFSVEWVHDYAQAHKVFADKDFKGIFCTFEQGNNEALTFIQSAHHLKPQTPKILWADYTKLPDIIGTPIGDILTRIMPKPGNVATLQRVISELFEEQTALNKDLTFFEQTRAVFDWMSAEKLLRWSTTSACHISGCVVRCLPTDLSAGQMQLVLKKDDAATAFIERLNNHWGLPYKAANSSLSLREKRHPLVKHIGNLWKAQTLYIRQVHEQDTYIYLIILPWEQ